MRWISSIGALGILTVALAALAPTTADATWRTRYYGYGPAYSNYPPVYGPVYGPPVVYGAPVYSVPPVYTAPPVYWSGQYRVTPLASTYYYQQYSPWTNQYRYQYRIYP